MEPKILICDEATSALDVTVQKQIMELLIKLKKEKNLAFIFICHDLALVQMFCDRVIVMHDGHVEEEGTPEEIIDEAEDGVYGEADPSRCCETLKLIFSEKYIALPQSTCYNANRQKKE